LFRRILSGSAAVILGVAAVTTSFASPHLVLQKSSVAKASGVYFSYGLRPGHQYQIRVVSKGHVKISALGTQQVTYLVGGKMGTMAKPLNFSGRTPYNLVLNQPGKVTALAWIFAMQVSDQGHQRLTVKLFDLGVHP
jgi:hypothetical protein